MPGLLVLRLDGPLYTANVRSVNRRITEAVERAEGVHTVIVDLTAVAMTSVTVALQFTDLERELGELGTTVWVAGLAPHTAELARNMPYWRELEATGRIHATALAATRAYRAP